MKWKQLLLVIAVSAGSAVGSVWVYGKFNEKNFNQDKSGSDLDIPGSELDDDQEDIGSEDEENNGYSIGSDNHNDLEENENRQ